MDFTPSTRDTYRPFTGIEVAAWMAGVMPCCGGTMYVRGPMGGASINLQCPRCDFRISVLDPDRYGRKPFAAHVIRERLP